MGGHRLGELAEERAELAQLVGQRLRRLADPVEDAVEARLHGGDAAAEVEHLAGEVGGAARQIDERAGGVAAAVARLEGDRVVDGEPGEGDQRDDRRLGRVGAHIEVHERAERTGDQRHAQADEDGTDAGHYELREHRDRLRDIKVIRRASSHSRQPCRGVQARRDEICRYAVIRPQQLLPRGSWRPR
ncbi:hypothetical protein CH338_13170 [Rhodoplanes elegans]|uniref:Uncharacterized protein n=1 Tax=Rhodoplanes elegans TaxID=29408 RepID=A0A327KLE5_9BRAD|nr:hypothetical protein CH338_13170 [Rhodoplanes elegans]